MRFFEITFLVVIAMRCSLILTAPAGEVIPNKVVLYESGGYQFGFNTGRISQQEERSVDGIVRGAYSYVDGDGEVQTVKYTADGHNGFVVSGSNIPSPGQEPAPVVAVIETNSNPIQYTPEVAAARAEHLAAVHRSLNGQPATLSLSDTDDPVIIAIQASKTSDTQYHPDYAPYANL